MCIYNNYPPEYRRIVIAIYEYAESSVEDLLYSEISWSNIFDLFRGLDAIMQRTDDRVYVHLRERIGIFVCPDEQAYLDQCQLRYICDYLRVVGVYPVDV